MINNMHKKVGIKTNKLAIISAVCLVFVNVIVLAGISYNRSGETNSGLQLTERELPLPYRSYRQKENSGLALKLNWNFVPEKSFNRSYDKYALKKYGSPNWLTENKLKELGLYIDSAKLDTKDSLFDNNKLQSEEFIIVLEYNGETFQAFLNDADEDIQALKNKAQKNPNDRDINKQLQKDEASLSKLKTSESRLIAIDAGRNLQTLKEKYTDNSKYLMLRGEIKRHWVNKKLTASIGQLFIADIHVPLPYSNKINEITNRQASSDEYSRWNGNPRYVVELNLGKRLEPWLVEVSSM